MYMSALLFVLSYTLHHILTGVHADMLDGARDIFFTPVQHIIYIIYCILYIYVLDGARDIVFTPVQHICHMVFRYGFFHTCAFFSTRAFFFHTCAAHLPHGA